MPNAYGGLPQQWGRGWNGVAHTKGNNIPSWTGAYSDLGDLGENEGGPVILIDDPSVFATEFFGLRGETTGGTVDISLVAVADAATSMGAVPMIDKNGTIYAVYLVETDDPLASPFRINTSAGVKALRLKTP